MGHETNGHAAGGNHANSHANPHGDSHGHHHAVNNKPLGIVDVLIAAVVFYVLTLGIFEFCKVATPDLLSPQTLVQIQLSGLLFLLTWMVLGPGVFKVFLDLAEQREARTTGDEAQAQVNLRKKRQLDEELDNEIRLARLRGLEKRDAKVLEAKKSAQAIIEEAQADATADVKAAQAEIEKLRETAAAEVGSEGQKLAGLVIDRALRAGGSPTIH